MWPASQELRDALAADHEMDLTVDVFRGDTWRGRIPVVACRVEATLLTQDGRTAGLLVDRGVTDDGLLNPLFDQVIIRSGIPDVDTVPIFTGRVDTHRVTETGDVAVSLISRADEVVRAPFEVPVAADTNTQIREQIRRLIQDADPGWQVDTSAAPADTVPASLVWEYNRADAVDELATAINCVVIPDRVGGFVIVPSRYVPGADVTPVATLRDGEDGVIVALDAVKSRRGITNSVTVVVERTDGSLPIRVTVRDDDSASPTRWGGDFGRQNVVIKMDSPRSTAEATAVATRVLHQSLALARAWRITIPHNPLFDPGDVIIVWHRGEPTAQVVESVRYSGAASDPTELATRELIVPVS